MSKLRGTVVLASHNPGKFAEFQALAEGLDVTFVPAPQLDLASPAETETTYLGNAQLKAVAAMRATGAMCLADDTGLEVHAWDGAPGVDTAGFAQTHGGWPGAIEFLSRTLNLARGDRPAATAVCALVFASPGAVVVRAEARVDGVLSWPPRPELPGFAAVFDASPDAFERDGVLLHRRRALAQLLS